MKEEVSLLLCFLHCCPFIQLFSLSAGLVVRAKHQTCCRRQYRAPQIPRRASKYPHTQKYHYRHHGPKSEENEGHKYGRTIMYPEHTPLCTQSCFLASFIHDYILYSSLHSSSFLLVIYAVVQCVTSPRVYSATQSSTTPSRKRDLSRVQMRIKRGVRVSCSLGTPISFTDEMDDDP